MSNIIWKSVLLSRSEFIVNALVHLLLTFKHVSFKSHPFLVLIEIQNVGEILTSTVSFSSKVVHWELLYEETRMRYLFNFTQRNMEFTLEAECE